MATIGKEEAARILGISERTLERNAAKYQREYGLKIVYEQGRTKRVPTYDRAQVVALAERLKTPITTGQLLSPEAAGELATQSDNGDAARALVAIPPAALALVEQLAERQHADAERIIAALGAARPVDTRPTWLTKQEAVAASGLPVTWLERATRGEAPQLRHIGRGRAWRVHRDELLRFAESFRDGEEGERESSL